MEVSLSSYMLRHPCEAKNLEEAVSRKPERVLLFRNVYEDIRKSNKAAPKDVLTFRGVVLEKGPAKRVRKKRPVELALPL